MVVERLGRMADRALWAERVWEVAAVFRRSVYCRSAAGQFVCAGPEGMGAGPLNLLCRLPADWDWVAAGLEVGSGAASGAGRLCLDAGWVLDLRGADPWIPAGIPADWGPALLAENLSRLADLAGGFPARGGLQGLIPPLAAGGPWPEEALSRLARAGVVPLAGWLEASLAGGSGAGIEPPEASAALLGLGPGLTPSGDDLLGGLLVALRALGHPALAARLGAWLLPRAADRTHPISRAHLGAAAAGEGAEALHQSLASLASPGASGLAAALAALDRIGHSSGWDALAGATLAAAALAGGFQGR